MKKSRNKKNTIQPPNLMMAVLQHLLLRRISTLLLVICTLISAFSLVLLTHEKRQSFAELEKLQIERDQLDIRDRELKLEQRMLAEHARLEDVAKEELDMKTLDLKSERILKRIKNSD